MKTGTNNGSGKGSAPTRGPRLGTAPVPAKPQGRIRLLLAEDHPVVRRGLRSILGQYPHIELLDEATDGQQALSKAKELAPDVVLMDIEMPHLNGLTVTEALAKEVPSIRVLILSTHSTVHHALRILKSGARGYVLKQASPEELVKAIETVAGGNTCFSPEVASLALNTMVRKSAGIPDPSQLSDREREILVLIAEGLYNKEIAARLNIGTRTVETHRERIMDKLNIHSTAGLTRFAIATGLLTVPEMQLG
jgi:DNA-binding NarL/FixJ family response regulator